MNLSGIWIFLIVISIVCFIISIGAFEFYYNGKLKTTDYWVFFVFLLGVIVLIAAFIIYAVDKAPTWCYRGKTCYPCKDPGQTCGTKGCSFTLT